MLYYKLVFKFVKELRQASVAYSLGVIFTTLYFLYDLQMDLID
jgi:hypothetical protein